MSNVINMIWEKKRVYSGLHLSLNRNLRAWNYRFIHEYRWTEYFIDIDWLLSTKSKKLSIAFGIRVGRSHDSSSAISRLPVKCRTLVFPKIKNKSSLWKKWLSHHSLVFQRLLCWLNKWLLFFTRELHHTENKCHRNYKHVFFQWICYFFSFASYDLHRAYLTGLRFY